MGQRHSFSVVESKRCQSDHDFSQYSLERETISFRHSDRTFISANVNNNSETCVSSVDEEACSDVIKWHERKKRFSGISELFAEVVRPPTNNEEQTSTWNFRSHANSDENEFSGVRPHFGNVTEMCKLCNVNPKLLDMFMEEINAIKNFAAGDFPSVRECDFSLWDKSGIIELLLEEAKHECIETKSLCLSTSSLETNVSEHRLPNLAESEDIFGRVLKKLKELGLKIEDSVEKVEAAVQKNDNNEYGVEKDIDNTVEKDLKVNDRPDGENFSKDMLDETESSLKEEIEDNESVDSGIHGMSSWDQDANTISESPGLQKQCLQNNNTVSAAMVCRPCEPNAPPSNQLNSQAQRHFTPAAKTKQKQIRQKAPKRYSPQCNQSDYGLSRNRLILHVVGSSRLRERLRNNELKSQSLLRPVHYHFWVPADEQTLRCFNNPADRRILSISRLSACSLRLQPVVRKDVNGMSVKQVLVDSPSLEALIRCCHMLDERFPLFNASVGLHCNQNISIEAKVAEEAEAMDKTSFIGFLLDQLEEEESTRFQ